MNHDSKVILEELRSLEFLWMGSEIRKWWFGELLGWNCYSSSIMRKPYTISRLQDFINENELPLEIKDNHDMVNSFKVFLKDAA